jgi:hypothetical protein
MMTKPMVLAAAKGFITRRWHRAGQWRFAPMGQDISARYFKAQTATAALACVAAAVLLLVLGAPARADDDCAHLRERLQQLNTDIRFLQDNVQNYMIAVKALQKDMRQYDMFKGGQWRMEMDAQQFQLKQQQGQLTSKLNEAAEIQLAVSFLNCADAPPAQPPTKADAPPAPDNPPASPSSAGGTDTTTPTSPVTPTADAPVPPSAPTTPTTTAATPAPLPPVQVGPTDTTTGFNVPPPTDSGGPTDQQSPSPEPLPVAALPPVMLPASAPSDPGNLPAVWCVMRNGTQKTVIRCDDTTGAGMGWTLVDTNLTWPAATLEAFGTPPTGGYAMPSGGGGRVTPQSQVAMAPGSGLASTGAPSPDGGFMPLSGGTPEPNDPTFGCYGPKPDFPKDEQPQGLLSPDNPASWYGAAPWWKCSGPKEPAAPPQPLPPIAVNAPPQPLPTPTPTLPPPTLSTPASAANPNDGCPVPPGHSYCIFPSNPNASCMAMSDPSTAVIDPVAVEKCKQWNGVVMVKGAAPPQSPPPISMPASAPASSPKACTPYACNYMQSTAGGAAESGVYEMDVCVPASGDWSAATCTIDSTTYAHAVAGQANPDSRTTCGPRPFFGVVKDHASFVQQCKSLNGRVTEPEPPTQHADVLPVAPLPPPVVIAAPQVDVEEPPAKTHKPATPRVAKRPVAPSHPNEPPAESFNPAAAAAIMSIVGGMLGGGGGGGMNPCHH